MLKGDASLPPPAAPSENGKVPVEGRKELETGTTAGTTAAAGTTATTAGTADTGATGATVDTSASTAASGQRIGVIPTESIRGPGDPFSGTPSPT
jgi:hypothetical protein